MTLELSNDIKEEGMYEVNCAEFSTKGTLLVVGLQNIKGANSPSMFIGYSLFKSGDSAGKPDWIINTPSSVTCINFHPKKRSIVAIGLANGSLEVHDVDKHEENSTRICNSDISEIFHTDEITSLQWCIYGVNKSIKMVLMSGSKDGKMLLWDMATRLKFPKRGYLLSVDKTKENSSNILISCKHSIGMEISNFLSELDQTTSENKKRVRSLHINW